MKTILVSVALCFTCLACTLHSQTFIKPKESFVLGNNQHDRFTVFVKNDSDSELTFYHAPVDGGRHSFQNLKPNEKTTFHVDKNTALLIENKTEKLAKVNLKVVGDLGLSMGYTNP